MNFCSIDEAWGDKQQESYINKYRDINERKNIQNENDDIKNKSNEKDLKIDESEECLSSSSIESFEVISKKKNKIPPNKYYKKGLVSNKKNESHNRSNFITNTISSLGTETFNDSEDSYNSSLIETFTESVKDKKNCNKLVNHIMKCKKCRDKLRRKFRPPLVKKINILFDDNKDLLVLILVGFAILIFLKLIYSVCSN